MTRGVRRSGESAAVVADDEPHTIAQEFQADACVHATGMAHDVVDRLFEYQVNMTADIGSEADIFARSRRLEPVLDVGAGEHVGREAAHSLDQVAAFVAMWMNRPYNLGDRVHQPARYFRNPLQGFGYRCATSVHSPPCDLAQQGDLGETRSDIVMEICGDACSYPLQLQRALQLVAMRCVDNRSGNCHRKEHKPPSPPVRRCDFETKCGRLRTRDSVAPNRFDNKAVAAGREIRVVDVPLRRWRTPVRARSFQLVPVLQNLAATEADSPELDHQTVLRSSEAQ